MSLIPRNPDQKPQLSLFRSHLDFLKHGRGEHSENQTRLNEILKIFKQSSDLGCALDLSGERLATRDELMRVHTADYIDRVFAMEGKQGEIDHETPLSEGSVRAARLAAGLGLELVDQVLDGPAKNGFLMARPPGHHARPSHGMGFCIFNTLALMAHHALCRGVQRILILDWDVHHGNGTQESFYGEDRVLFVDLHQESLFPKDTGMAQERGEAKGLGFTFNIPLPHSCGDADYLAVLRKWVAPRVSAFRPELILVSAGFDAHISDPLGSMSLSTTGYGQMTLLVKAWAEEFSQGKVIFNLEGGYDPAALAKNVFECARVLAGFQPHPLSGGGEVRDDLEDWMAKVIP